MKVKTYNLAKWLTKEFEKLPNVQSSFSVKKSLDFIKNLENVSLEYGEILISFDICSLFPTEPILGIYCEIIRLVLKD